MRAKGFWPRVFSDWPAKVLSLAVALLLFFFFHLNKLEQRTLTVPLALVTNGEFVPSSQYPRTVKLSLRGESADLFQIQEDDIRASVDFSEVRRPGLSKATIAIEKRGNAVEVDPLEILPDPATISVTMDRKISRVVPVTPTFHGFLDPGFELKSFDLAPGEVTIEGPSGAMERITDVTTEPIELSGRHGDFVVKTRLARANALVSVAGTDTAEFRGAVVKSVTVKSFTSVLPTAYGLQDGLALAETLPALRLKLKSQTIDLQDFQLAPDSLLVDLSQIRRAGSYSIPVQVKLPEGIQVESLEPAVLSIRILPRQGGLP